MPTINVLKPFKFAHRGCDVQEFEPGQVDTTDEVAEVALAEGWAEQLGGPADGTEPIAPADGELAEAPADFADTQPAETAAHTGAPETADVAPQRRRKGA